MEFRHIDEVGITTPVTVFGNVNDKANLVTIEAVRADFVDDKERLGVLIYGKCAAGDDCNHVHGVLIQPSLFFALYKKFTAEIDEEIADEMISVLLDIDKKNWDW